MRSTRTIATILLTITFLAACSSGAPSTGTEPSGATAPSPTATPVATPSPTPSPSPPPDVTAEFAAALGDPLYQARMTVTGSLTVGGVTMPVTGTVEVAPNAGHAVMTVKLPTGPQTTEMITIGDRTYVRAYGVWFETTAGTPAVDATTVTTSAPSPDLGAVTGGAGGFRDDGIVTRDGRELHHLVLPAETVLPPTDFGLADPSISSPEITVEFWAEDDGQPVAMRIDAAWKQEADGRVVAVSMTLDYVIARVPVTITAPSETWAWRTSAAHKYQVAYPADWDVNPGNRDTADYYVGWDGTVYGVWRAKTDGATLNSLTSYLTRNLAKVTELKGAKLDGNVAAKLDGVKARRLTFHGTYDGMATWSVEVIAVKGGYVTFVAAWFDHEPTEADLEQLQVFLDTFSFT